MLVTTTTRGVTAAFLLMLSLAPAQAFNTLFLRDSAMSAMSDAEFELMKQSFYRALNELGQGETLEWGSADAAHGSITVGKSFTYSGYECRETRFESVAGSNSGGGELKFCQDKQGEWKILTTPQ